MKLMHVKIVMAAALLLGAGACKQGRGDRCQINSDCASGLVCNQATQTCQDTTGTGIDATLPTDGPPKMDAPPMDGPMDAPKDGPGSGSGSGSAR